ncbi:xanthine dehydrogenase family protein molybdopterin-binding subunit [Acidovorax sp. A1169]|uniref:xanthine dehydrogenase family protein molybdopterin-binding subunit n=1 Tax=Acidovorax sp. A1169 TaxID=3059524 RepID=UPI002737E1B6|nr:molybdopterin cofactor-binding domain-containing protein [Acidovorax sp. A1169]MDP4078881.1 molybdopterin-dependent oxidoreductase [Acidovorax sp. A1169]
MKRRHLLAGTGLAAITVVFGAGCSLVPVIPKRPTPGAEDAQGWIRHDADGRYTLWVPCTEMGQQISTALQGLAAAELGVEPQAVQLRLPATGDIARVRATVGSASVQDFALPLAQACATLREALLANGVAAAGNTTLRSQPLPARALRSFQALARADASGSRPAAPPAGQLHAIVTGQPLFAGDTRLPGMLYGRVLRAPVSAELDSRPSAMDEATARADPACIAVVRSPLLVQMNSLGVGIVARSPAALERIEAALAVQWQVDGDGFEAEDIAARIDIDRYLARGALRHRPRSDAMPEGGTWSVDLRMDIPLAAHAPIEPRSATAAWRRSKAQQNAPVLRVWAGTQDLFYVRDVLARNFSLSAEQIEVQACRVGGGFGGRTLCTVELEAAVLAQAVGAPVKVHWSRAQEFAQGFQRPPSSHRVRARVHQGREQSRVTHWWHAFASSHILFTPAAMPPWMQSLADFAGDSGVARGSQLAYAVPQQRTEFTAQRLPVHTGPWRGLGAGPNTLVVESAMDECARHAGADPLAWRLAHTSDARLAAAFERVAREAHWKSRPTSDATTLRGRGIAGGIYKGVSYAAAVADVAVNRATGQVRVTAIWCAHDCGLVLQPDGVRAQTEGNLVWCLGMVLHEELPVAASRVAATTFADYPLPRMGDVPPLHVYLIDSSASPTGAGETAMVAGAGAIANALRDATGHRFTRFPVRSGDVLQALKG